MMKKLNSIRVVSTLVLFLFCLNIYGQIKPVRKRLNTAREVAHAIRYYNYICELSVHCSVDQDNSPCIPIPSGQDQCAEKSDIRVMHMYLDFFKVELYTAYQVYDSHGGKICCPVKYTWGPFDGFPPFPIP